MLRKMELVCAVAICLFGGYAFGYTKARERYLQAICLGFIHRDEQKNLEKEGS